MAEHDSGVEQPTGRQPRDPSAAFDDGWRVGMATAAVTVALCSFISLLGVEKAILAIVLGALGVKGAARAGMARRLGLVAIVVSSLFLVTVAIVFALYHDRLTELLRLLQHLS